jgi:predicted membrane protein
MTSRQRLGLILVILGALMFINNVYPEIFKAIAAFISFPVLLVILGLYLVLSKK